MSASALYVLAESSIAASAAVLLVALIRKPLRRLAGPEVACWLWLLVPASTLVVLLPVPPRSDSDREPILRRCFCDHTLFYQRWDSNQLCRGGVCGLADRLLRDDDVHSGSAESLRTLTLQYDAGFGWHVSQRLRVRPLAYRHLAAANHSSS